MQKCVKRLATLFLCTVYVAISVAAQNARLESPNPRFDPIQAGPGDSELETVLDKLGLPGLGEPGLGDNASDAKTLNGYGFNQYQKKDYANALVLFRAAASADSRMVVAHFNIACVLSLMGAKPGSDTFEELLYHLHRSVELDPTRVSKISTDGDLAGVRDSTEVRNLIAIADRNARWLWKGFDLYRVAQGKEFFVATAGKNESPFGSNESPLFAADPQKAYIAFARIENGEAYVAVATPYGRTQTIGKIGNGPPLWNFEVLFSADGQKLAAPLNDGIWVWNAKYGMAARMTVPDPDYAEDIPLEWRGEKLRFKRGTFFEFSFAGAEWELNMSTGKSVKVPGGKVWRGESLR